MSDSNIESVRVRLAQVIFGLAFLAVSLYLAKSSMFGSTHMLKMGAGAFVLFGIIFALDKKYWMLAPVACIDISGSWGLPFPLHMLGCAAVVAVHFFRVGFHHQRNGQLRYPFLPATVLMAWILFMYTLNPCGIGKFNSSMIGGMFYIKIIVGYLTLLVFSNITINEESAKTLFKAMVIFTIILCVRSILGRHGSQESEFIGEMEEAGSRYYLNIFFVLFSLLISRYNISQILGNLKILLPVLLCMGAITLSGKRRLFAELYIYPLIRILVTGREKIAFAALSIIAAFMVVFAAAGHQMELYTLPRSAVRAIAIVVPSLRTGGLITGTKDLFRERVHRYGNELIREHPFVGRKGLAMDREMTAWRIGQQTRNSDATYEGSAAAGNWHSMWYSFACDFGIPGLLMWLWFCIATGIFTWRLLKQTQPYTWIFTCSFFSGAILFTTILFGMSTGHSTESSFTMFTNLAFLFALRNGYNEEETRRQKELQAAEEALPPAAKVHA